VRSSVRDFDVAADDIAATIDAHGVACIRNVVTDEWLDTARMWVHSYLPLASDEPLFVIDPAGVRDSVASRLAGHRAIESLLESVAAVGYPDCKDSRIENELRIEVGTAAPKPLWLHYDGPVVTMVVPIAIPSAAPGTSGELILWANRRPYRRLVVTNIVEKFICQSELYRKWFVRKLSRKPDSATVVPLTPGNIYLFWGYRSYHATLPVPSEALLATLMLHFGAVHGRSPLLTVSKAVKQRIRARRGTPNTAKPHDVAVPVLT
jgi:hypothetical protein